MKQEGRPFWRRLWVLALVFFLLSPTALWTQVEGNEERRRGALFDLGLEELMDIEVISVRRRPERLFISPSAVHAITARNIRRSGATNIPDALRTTPGMYVARTNSQHWAIGARGFAENLSNKLLVMIDGRSIYTPLFSGVFWDTHDTFLPDIDRIEVIRGPGASIWGANAVNGVINIQTKDAAETQGTLLYFGGGSFEHVFAGIRQGSAVSDKTHVRVYASHFNRGKLPRPEGTAGNGRWRISRVGFRSDWRPSTESHVMFQGNAYAGRLHQTMSRTSPDPPHEGFLRDVPTDVRGGYLMGSLFLEQGRDSHLILKSYLDHNVRDRRGSYREDRTTFDFEFHHVYRISERNRMTWGAGYRVTSDRLEGSFDLEFIPRSRTDHLFTVFVQNENEVIDQLLTITLGTKVEHNDYTGLEIQPSVRAVFTPGEWNAFWAAVSRAVRSPSRLEHGVRINNPPLPGMPPDSVTSIFTDGTFRDEELLALELGWRSQPSETVNFDLSGFYNLYDNLRSVEPLGFRDEPPPPHLGSILENRISGETYGFEVSGSWRPKEWWQWMTGYSFLRVHMRRDAGGEDQRTVNLLEGGSPRHQLFLQSGANLPGGWTLSGIGRYVDSLPGLGVDSYVSLDLRIAWQPWDEGPEFSVVGQNLLRGRHAEFGSGQVRRSVYGKMTWAF